MLQTGQQHKSSYSNSTGNCVVAERLPDGNVAVTDSKLGADSPVLTFTPYEWLCFLAGVKANEFEIATPGERVTADGGASIAGASV